MTFNNVFFFGFHRFLIKLLYEYCGKSPSANEPQTSPTLVTSLRGNPVSS